MRPTLTPLLIAILLALGSGAASAEGHINWITISGSINPASSDHIQRAVAQSEDDGAVAVLIELDTPGGLLTATKDIIQSILNAEVPVIVFVAPRGAWAASAGTFITMAAHKAAMAPGTSIGAAHPVGIGGGGGGGGGGESEEDGKKGEGKRDFSAEKAENFTASFIESIAKERNRNVEWAVKAVRESVAVTQDEALELGVIDLVAGDRKELLAALDGQEVEVNGRTITLALANAELREIEWTTVNRFLNVLASPDVAVMLMMAGMLLLYVEFSNPGLILPGVAGGVSLILGMIALQILPFSWFGLLLLVGGVAFFVAEVFVTSYGLLTAAGVACFLVGGSMVFDLPEVSDLNVSFWSVLVPSVIGMAAFAALVVFALGRSFRRPQVAGVDDLIGTRGSSTTALAPNGTVFVRGEYWHARSAEPIAEGDRIEVLAVEGMELRVRRAPPS